MSEWKVRISDADIDAALEDAKNLPERPIAVSAEYKPDLDLFVIRLDNGNRLVLPREQLQGLQDATEAQLADIEIFSGVSIGWRQLDIDHYLPSLIEGRYGSEKWMQSLKNRNVAA